MFSLVILAGLAGSLRREFAAGQAHAIAEVRDDAGAIIARSPVTHASIAGPIVAQVDRVMVDRAGREALASASGADLVDLESAAFARLAESRGWRWAIVRGVSDDPHTLLPVEASTWIASDGATRVLAVARSLLRRPALARELKRLHDNSRTALASCAAQIRALLLSCK